MVKGQSYYDGNSLKPGHLEIKDLNGDGIINYNDRVIIGNPDPDLFGGLPDWGEIYQIITNHTSYRRVLKQKFGEQHDRSHECSSSRSRPLHADRKLTRAKSGVWTNL